MKYIFALLICLFSPLVQAEKCTTDALARLDDIANCAKNGDRTAQYLLGQIYFKGMEVPKDYKTAFEWMSKAANQGDKDAQAFLGLEYFNGWDTKRDHVLAYMWWSLAIVDNEDPVTRKSLDDLEQELSAADLARAQKMASDWSASHSKNLDSQKPNPQQSRARPRAPLQYCTDSDCSSSPDQ